MARYKSKRSNLSDLTEVLKKVEQGEYGIGVHGIDKGAAIQEKQNIADSINENGLNINNNGRTILSTLISLGVNEETKKISEEIIGYQFGSGPKINVVLAVPLYIQSKSGEKIFLGFPDENKRTAGQQYEDHCILDIICARMKKIPPQFILGYYFKNLDESEGFMENEQHYLNMTLKEREDLFKELYSSMDEFSKTINELINSGNTERLEQILKRMEESGFSTSLLKNAIKLAERGRGQFSVCKILSKALEDDVNLSDVNGARVSTEQQKGQKENGDENE